MHSRCLRNKIKLWNGEIYMLGFIIGLFLGAFIGVAVMCLCSVASEADKNKKEGKDEK